jgi:L-ascorbate metabolism protein UlaG (beta-lactamase superfamily)
MAFPGTTPYTAADLPPIDVPLVTHDHWDHLDYPTAVGQSVAGEVTPPAALAATH